MDNASKALIIAGAILLAIILISVGVIIVKAVTNVTSEAGTSMENMASSIFNNKFDKYLGQKVSGAQVKSFISEVINNNSISSSPIYINFYYMSGNKKNNYKYNSKNATHITKSGDLQNMNNIFVELNKSYSIVSTSNCGKYKGGIRPDGTYGCISIIKLN